MTPLRAYQTSNFNPSFFAASAALVVTVVLLSPGTAAQTVTFTYNYQCNYLASCPSPQMTMGGRLGVTGGDVVPIATVNSDVAGYTQPVPIDGGSLNWASSPATFVVQDGLALDATYGVPGGRSSIVGSVFGLPPGSTLLTASFKEGGDSHLESGYYSIRFSANINISFVAPAILENLGLKGLPNYGTGTVYDFFQYDGGNGILYYQVSVTFTPGPQCGHTSFSKASTPGKLTEATNDPAGNFQVLHNFTGAGDGGIPVAPVTITQAGNLYGTTEQGGSSNGTVFRLRQFNSNWVLNPLYSFAAGNSGAQPAAGVTIGPGGTLYGTVSSQGSGGVGAVFSLNPQPNTPPNILGPWSENVLQAFTGTNGSYPYGNLIFGQAGNIYGTTLYNVFELIPNSGGGWTEQVLYGFGSKGGITFGGVVFDKAGNLYGTTWGGGDSYCWWGNGCGTVFQLTPSGGGWNYTRLYTFEDGTDGRNPAGGLIVDASDNLYGTTNGGGIGASGGTVFMLSPSNGSWTFKVLYTFTGGQPFGNLAMDSAGNLYGTTYYNSTFGPGSVFKLTPTNGGWTETDLYVFSGADGAYPMAGVTLAEDGSLFGTTAYGGASSCGVVFKLKP